jgi:hypothetical protein
MAGRVRGDYVAVIVKDYRIGNVMTMWMYRRLSDLLVHMCFDPEASMYMY